VDDLFLRWALLSSFTVIAEQAATSYRPDDAYSPSPARDWLTKAAGTARATVQD
jgi:hypothetical protein